MLTTFYSFKGGVGRSMALVNVGEILADWGYNVILCDWDLEAPGVERYLTADPLVADDAGMTAGRVAAEVTQFTARPGLMDLLYEYKATMAEPPDEVLRKAREEVGEDPSVLARSFKQVGKLYLRRPSTYAFHVSAQRTRQGSLRLLTAGRRDPNSYKAYAEAVRTFDWEEFYRKWAGASYIEFFREDLTDASLNGADIVLVDSRTGVTEHGGVATHHLADLVILLSAANEMNLEGTDWMARELSSPRLKETRGNRGLGVLPVPSRIEQTSQKDELVSFRRRFAERFGQYALEFTQADAEKFFLDLEIPYMPYYSFYERVAAREGRSREQRLYGAYEFIAQSVVAHGLRAGLLAKQPKQARPIELAESRRGAPTSRVEGVMYLGCSPADAELASVLVRGLKAEGVRVWADTPAGNAQLPVEQAASEAAGYLVLVGEGGLDERAQAEFDFALRQQVLKKDCRLIPVLRDGVEQKNLPVDFVKLRPVILPHKPSPDDGELFRRLAAEINAPPASNVFPDSIPPYCGFSYFEGHVARFFFGRDEEVRGLVRNLGETATGHARWLQIEGVNGSGKTSLARAGLIPAVQRGWLRGAPKEWLVIKTAVADDYIESLSVALGYATGQRLTPSELQSWLSRPGGLREIVRKSTPVGHGFLLLVDGVDDLSDDAGGQTRLPLRDFFESQLPAALEDRDLPFYLLTTARTDATRVWDGSGRLGAIFEGEARRFVVDVMPLAGLREVVEGPAKLTGLNFEEGLVERIVADACDFRVPLAVLGPLLQSLWRKRAGSTLTHQSYQELGGAGGVLQAALEALLGELNHEELECAKRILLRLVRVFDAGDGLLLSGASAPVPRAEVLESAGGEVGRRVLNRLLSPPCPVVLAADGDALALAHGELTRQGSLRAWIEPERETLRLREDLKSSVRLREVSLKPDAQLFARFNLDAEELFASLAVDEKVRFMGILSRLVAYDPEMGDAFTTKVIPIESIRDRDRPLVDKMRETRLVKVVTGATPDEIVSLSAHEFLLPGWTRFREWVAANDRLLRLRHPLTVRAEEWRRHGRDPELLLRGAAIKQAIELNSQGPYLSEAEQDYIMASAQASRIAERKSWERKARLIISGLLGVVVLLMTAYIATNRYQAVSRERDTFSRAYIVALSESYFYRARLHLSQLSEGIGSSDSMRLAVEALGKVVELNRNTQPNSETTDLTRQAVGALQALEAGDLERARKLLGDSPSGGRPQ